MQSTGHILEPFLASDIIIEESFNIILNKTCTQIPHQFNFVYLFIYLTRASMYNQSQLH